MSAVVPPPGLAHRFATEDDFDAIRSLMDLAIEELQKGFLTPEQIKASHMTMGLDTSLIRDRTYFIVQDVETGEMAGCGGWSRRATLYGGDHSTKLRDERLLDPQTEPAKIRAMYTHPNHTRKGVGRYILALGEAAAKAEGFKRIELGGTMAGVPLYESCGYEILEKGMADPIDGVEVPVWRMGKDLD